MLQHLDYPLSNYLLRDVFLLVGNNFYPEDHIAQEQAIRLLVNNHDIDFLISSLEDFRGSEEAFLALRNQTDMNHFHAPFKIRARVASQLATWPHINGPGIFRLALQPGPMLPADVQEESIQLLPAVAGAIGDTARAIAVGNYSHHFHKDLAKVLLGNLFSAIPNLRLTFTSDWRSLLREFIGKGADPNSAGISHQFYKRKRLTTHFQTPFLRLLGAVQIEDTSPSPWKLNETPLELWLQDLQACGVDLLEYGRREKAVHGQASIMKHFQFCKTLAHGLEISSWHVVDFTFGSSPSDWHVEMAKCATKKCLVEFFPYTWLDLGIEPDEKSIPGAWVHDDDDDDDEEEEEEEEET